MRRWLLLALSAPFALAGIGIACSSFEEEAPGDTEGGVDGSSPIEAGANDGGDSGEGGVRPFTARWARAIGGEGHQTAAGLGVDESRNLYLVGGVDNGIIDFGCDDAGAPVADAGRDGYLARFREDGSCVWARRIGGPGDQEMIATSVTGEGRSYATGITTFTPSQQLVIGTKTIEHKSFVGSYAVAFDNEGKLNDAETIFTQAGGDTTNFIQLSFSIAALDDRFVWAGNSNADFGADQRNYFTTTGANAGMFVGRRAAWLKGFPVFGTVVQTPHATAVGPGNVVYVGGDFQGTISLPDGGTLMSPTSDFDAFLTKLAADGTPLWTQSFGDTTGQRIYSIVANKVDDTILFAGETAGIVKIGSTTIDPAAGHAIFFAKMSSNGAPIWVKAIKVGAKATEPRIALRDGRVLVGANVSAPADCGGGALPHRGDEDFFLCVFRETDGSFVGGVAFGGPGKDRLRGLAWLQGGDIAVAGQFRAGSFDLGGKLMTANTDAGSETDIFVARLSAP